MQIRISGGRLIDPAHGIDARRDLYIAQGQVVGLGRAPAGFEARRTIDARGRIVCPGLVDLAARVREPGAEHKATVATETLAAVAGGITTLCCPPDTAPVVDTPAVAELIHQRAAAAGRARVVCLGALTRGLAGEVLAEMHALKQVGCVGVSNAAQPIASTEVLRRAFEYAATCGLAVFIQPQDYWLGRHGCMHEGVTSTRLGIPAIPQSAETVALARDLLLVEHSGVRAHFGRISTARGARMIGEARRRGLAVSADVSAHHLHLIDEDVGQYDAMCHVQPPLRSRRDRTGLRQGLARGVIAAVCSDHQPHDHDAKSAPFSATMPGISALETLLPLSLALVRDGELALVRALEALTCGPAGILGLDCGHLGVGARADVCVFDLDASWTPVAATLVSAGKNSPFLGRTLTGRVTHTLVAGRLVYELPSAHGGRP
ncbi:MAG: dihydroorotase [Gammaproteobacteria bacterium]|nr:dihydroorotase [Gammaproteobacteria bacterium]